MLTAKDTVLIFSSLFFPGRKYWLQAVVYMNKKIRNLKENNPDALDRAFSKVSDGEIFQVKCWYKWSYSAVNTRCANGMYLEYDWVGLEWGTAELSVGGNNIQDYQSDQQPGLCHDQI